MIIFRTIVAIRKITYLLLPIALCFSTISPAQEPAGLKLSSVLQSNMVIQQNKPLKIWGQAPANEAVWIQADWMDAAIQVKADPAGAFLGIIQVPQAHRGDFSNHWIDVKSQTDRIRLDSLLIGDVWLLSGQSNMQFSVKEMLDGEKEITDAAKQHIRLLNVDLNFSSAPLDDFSGTWKHSTPASVRDFSAVGYVFGQTIHQKLQIPIGLIFSGIGASAVQAYIPQDVLQRDTILNDTYLQPYLDSERSKEIIDGGFTFEKVTRPFLLYNAMIHPFLDLSIKGFCWYQGESNHFERAEYTRATQTMIQAWRERFAQGELPFYYVQIAPFAHEKADSVLTFDAFFREAQENIATLNNTAMVVSMDVGDLADIHPKAKKQLGIRLAHTALNRTYGLLEVPYLGPHIQFVAFEEGEVVVHFNPETVEGGLNTNDGKSPRCFSLAGEDQVFYPARAVIQGNKILLSSTNVKAPVAMRYAFDNNAITNLQNINGFPAVPFRSDSWPEE